MSIDLKSSDTKMSIFTGIIAISTAIYVIVNLFMFNELQESNDINSEIISLNQKSIKLTLRPFVFIEDNRVNLENAGKSNEV